MGARRLAAIALATMALTACGPAEPSDEVIDDGAITIASFDFAESELVAEIYAGALRKAGFDTNHIRRVGGREMLLPALERGLIEVVPEYSGSAVSFLGGAATSDATATARRSTRSSALGARCTRPRIGAEPQRARRELGDRRATGLVRSATSAPRRRRCRSADRPNAPTARCASRDSSEHTG